MKLVLQLLAYTTFSAVLQIVRMYGIYFIFRTYGNTVSYIWQHFAAFH